MAKKEKRARWWDKFFKQPTEPIGYNWADVLSGVAPIYSNGYNGNIYACDVVQQAIYSIVSELKKLDPKHVRQIGGDLIGVSGNIQNVLDAPNPLMTTSDFIEKVAWTLLLNYNAFIYPIWDKSHATLIALYPLQPSEVAFDTDYGGSGETWVQFTFRNGEKCVVPYNDIIHLRYRFSVSEFMGGNEIGQPDFEPLKETIKLNETLLRGLAKSLNLQTTINGVVKIKTMQNKEEQIAKIAEFEEKLQANKSGLLPIDVSSEYVPITKQVQLLDATTLEFIDKKILRTFGVSIPIVNGDYTKEQYEAFYQKTLEPIVKSFGQAFTKGIFTKHAAQGFNNKIVFYVKELIFMNTSQKIEMARILGDRGSLFENELRTMFGLPPLAELEGVRMMSLNYVDVKNAKEYQVGEKGGTNNE